MNEPPVLISLEYIRPNPFQVRQAADPAAVTGLAENIRRNGLLQPPTVRLCLQPSCKRELSAPETPDGLAYELAFGHMRLAAFKLLADQDKLEYRQIPCFVKSLDDLQMFEFAVAENIKRRDLNPVEQARAMQRYMTEFKKSSQETGEFFGVAAATIRGTVRLLDLPEAAKSELASGRITIGAARQLLILIRAAPDSLENAVQKIVGGELPEKVIEGALDEIVYKNKAIKMWAGWRSGTLLGGPGLWELDTPGAKFARYLQPLSVLGDVNIRLAKKALAGEELTAENRPRLQEWTNQLNSGLVAAEALIAQGAPADVIERLDQLVHPPACTACPFYVRAMNNHYCAWKICHTRKKEAWSLLELEQVEKKMKIKNLTVDEAKVGFVVLDYALRDDQQALVEAHDPGLRLHAAPGQYSHAFTGSKVIELVTVDPKVVEAQKIQNSENRARGQDDKERQARWERERKFNHASEKFIETEVLPAFSHLLDALDNLGFLMALAGINDDQFEPAEGKKSPSRKEKLQRCRMDIIERVIEDVVYEAENEKGPVVVAGYFQGVARTWAVELPEDWLERAESYMPPALGSTCGATTGALQAQAKETAPA